VRYVAQRPIDPHETRRTEYYLRASAPGRTLHRRGEQGDAFGERRVLKVYQYVCGQGDRKKANESESKETRETLDLPYHAAAFPIILPDGREKLVSGVADAEFVAAYWRALSWFRVIPFLFFLLLEVADSRAAELYAHNGLCRRYAEVTDEKTGSPAARPIAAIWSPLLQRDPTVVLVSKYPMTNRTAPLIVIKPTAPKRRSFAYQEYTRFTLERMGENRTRFAKRSTFTGLATMFLRGGFVEGLRGGLSDGRRSERKSREIVGPEFPARPLTTSELSVSEGKRPLQPIAGTAHPQPTLCCGGRTETRRVSLQSFFLILPPAFLTS